MLQFRRSNAPMRRPAIIAIASVALVAGVAAALSVPQPSSAAANAAVSSIITDAQKTEWVFDRTNEVRAEAGTTPLVRNSALDQVAADWAYQQWKNRAMSHNPNYSTQIPAGWAHAGENVASGYTYDAVVQAWVDSPEHYRNLVGDYTDLGVGYYQGADGKRYWSQVFGKYASTRVPPMQAPSSAPGAYPPEPAAPAGTGIPLNSASFEGSWSGWTASGAMLDGPNTNARGGKYALAILGGRTVTQSVSTTVTVGETDTVTIWVKPGSSAEITGSLTLTAVGGISETATTSFSDGTGWMRVSVGLPIAQPGHTGLRIDVVLSASGRPYRLDSASLVRTKNAPIGGHAPTPSTSPSSRPSTRPSTPTAPAPAPSASAPTPSSTPTPTPTPTPTTPILTPTPQPKSGLLQGLLSLLGG